MKPQNPTLNDAILKAANDVDGECELSESYITELRAVQVERRFTVTGVLLDADNIGMDFSLKPFCQNIYRTSELTDEKIMLQLSK